MTDRIMEQFQVQHRKKAYGLLRLTALDKSRDQTDHSWKMVTEMWIFRLRVMHKIDNVVIL